MLTTIALSICYVTGASLFIAICAAIGGMFPVRAEGDHAADWWLTWFTRGALGLATISSLVAVLGIASVLYTWLLWPIVIALAVMGWWVRRHEGWPRCVADRQPRAIRVASAIVCAGMLVGALHVIVGGLAPDAGQDAMWYHLSVPAQWVMRHELTMFSNVMPSTYMLAADAPYAAMLMVGDEIFCTSVYAQISLIATAWFVLCAWRIGGARAALGVAALVPALYLPLFIRAPVSAMTDMICGWWMGAACWMLLRPSLEGRSIAPKEWIMAGALLGTSIGGKLFTAGFAAPMMAVVAVTAIFRREPRAVTGPLMAGLAIVAMILPWVFRGLVNGVPGAGNPVAYVAPGLFPANPEFAPALAGYDLDPRFYGAIGEMLTTGMMMKIRMIGSEIDPLFLMVLLAGLCLLLAARNWRERSQGAIVLCCYACFLPIRGNNEIVRYFGLGYLLAAPAIAYCFVYAQRHTNARTFSALVLVLFCGSMASGAARQYRWGRQPTINWPYHPVVTESAKDEWLAKTEIGGYHRSLVAAQEAIPRDATVVLMQCPSPYYLNRRAYWTDYCRGSVDLLHHWWRDAPTPAGRFAILRDRKIDYLLSTSVEEKQDEILELQALGYLNEIVPAGEPTYRLWKLRKDDAK
ncbi:hypothetical protein BH09SUM1_BH09SUM1_28750 [soil metagenome]